MDKKTLQNPISIDHQIDNLISKVLIIEDKEYAKSFLSKVSYFRFIKVYGIGLKPVNGDYYLKPEDKKAIAKGHYDIGYTYLESWINSISYVRNICAHYGRLYNIKLVKQPMLYKEYKEINNYRILAVILYMKHIIKNELLWLTFRNDLLALVEKYSTSINLEYIGFIEGWENLI